jgi:hypothetical protein
MESEYRRNGENSEGDLRKEITKKDIIVEVYHFTIDHLY